MKIRDGVMIALQVSSYALSSGLYPPSPLLEFHMGYRVWVRIRVRVRVRVEFHMEL